MNCCIDELCNKDVINIENGCRIGYVFDVEVDMGSGHISTLLIAENSKGLSFKRPDCLKVCWADVVVIGDETILVKNVPQIQKPIKQTKSFFDIFSK
ncbi:MAG: YlmC/YmxH family sporulation protein [Clostridia bacterium]|nr:YlmC/YmxH family sporulation protein [Clostridia bacterium]